MKIQHLKLHHFPATRSTRVKWMLHEVVGEAFEIVKVELYGGAQYRPEFLNLNPNHNVPLLEITWEDANVQLMLESAAIVTFLADAYPEKGLAPAPGASRERADYLQMLHFGSTWMDMMLWQVRIHEHVLSDAERDDRTIARYRKKFTDEVEPQLARRLESSSYICGDTFTAADCVVGHSVFWARGYGMCLGDVFARYTGTLAQRPSFGFAFADLADFSLSPPPGNPLVSKFTG